MTLFLILALMTAAAIFAVLWPLSRRPPEAATDGYDVAVYRDQLDEVERDRKSGLIADSEAEAARLEISRRLLGAADREVQPSSEVAGSLWRRRVAALTALIALPVIAAGLYINWGSPHLPGAPLAARLDLPPEQRSIESMVAQVEAHLERNPEDGRGWDVVAPVYMRMGRYNDAVRARANALRLLGASADREADLGEAMVAAGNSIVTADAKASFERALKIDPNHLKAQYFIGLAAEQDGRPEEAAQIWRAMLARAPANAPFRPLVVQSLARVDKGEPPKGIAVEPRAPQPGPTQEDMAAAQQLTPEQRTQMVRGMVDRLAERLKTDTADFEGWLRLVRAYVVMGDADKAREALVNARNAIGSDDDKRRRLDDLAKGLGIDG
ncbi:c-type cytochrome biogenesis protein CcmI [Pseudorhodoplanes sinuspersici]|uniref:C-type cytochrome biogenesis protein CcmI n=1 Tax=Pseudorhodoplanes sinuspersici TaxID=1235591 RepID=A0A1W6ZV21_9HYPH|nr:c-type cytochrome biogenesis protein CcmI [Pseudorhodoplanes sinuspersici]ARQ00971.1 c-type cytochrome biogenesis protein CcmI [Pseudorhodoplanes sinuspersici]RKE72607.1 cytochrome c-type biogenesis protein CcmH [Pseudorhodoplanes sinuspersici]